MKPMETDTEPKQTPKTVEDLIWDFYQGDCIGDQLGNLLSALLDAGKITLAIEVLKVAELRRISGNIDKIAVEGISAALQP